MNTKLIGYDEAVKKLKELGIQQMQYKKYQRKTPTLCREWNKILQKNYMSRKKDINMLLSIVSAHKEARRMYGIIRELRDTLGLSTKERQLVEKVLND
jgi:hypothetical protein